ncbi:hypothetical protein DEJ50_11965 [Streptomyces venezuelae]|uniref:Uncharacterized protein n=1 Tax=Streptomyces venezuelae TaxID=54571 RepID=A0A5P2CZV2_STRVZ|nr:hypothetical protein DEJ50_11965 [Streptomyces venezuelae]
MLPQELKTWESLSPAQRALATALQETLKQTDCSQTRIAEAARMRKGTLSTHLTGSRVPTAPLLKDFYLAVKAETDASGKPLPYTIDQLMTLRDKADVRHCRCCTEGRGSSAHVNAEVQQTDSQAPASPQSGAGQRRMHRARRKRAMARQSAAAVASPPAPVPSVEGDRRPKTEHAAVAAWTELETVTHHLSEGNTRDAGILLWQAGRSSAAEHVLEAVASCRQAGLHEAAEAVLMSVSERVDRQAVLNITAVLHEAGRYEDVRYLLSASAQ